MYDICPIVITEGLSYGLVYGYVANTIEDGTNARSVVVEASVNMDDNVRNARGVVVQVFMNIIEYGPGARSVVV